MSLLKTSYLHIQSPQPYQDNPKKKKCSNVNFQGFTLSNHHHCAPGTGGDDDGMFGLMQLSYQFHGGGYWIYSTLFIGLHQGAIKVKAKTHGARHLTEGM